MGGRHETTIFLLFVPEASGGRPVPEAPGLVLAVERPAAGHGGRLPEFDKWNKRIIEEGESLDIKSYALDRNGGKIHLGIWEYEKGKGVNANRYSYRYFKSFGAKKYLYDQGDGILHSTVAGLSKSASSYLQEHGGIESIDIGFDVPPKISGRTSATYNDVPEPYLLNWKGHEILNGSNIAVEDTKYTFNITSEWFSMILDSVVEPDDIPEEEGCYYDF